jgi:hypothetical protein
VSSVYCTFFVISLLYLLASSVCYWFLHRLFVCLLHTLASSVVSFICYNLIRRLFVTPSCGVCLLHRLFVTPSCVICLLHPLSSSLCYNSLAVLLVTHLLATCSVQHTSLLLSIYCSRLIATVRNFSLRIAKFQQQLSTPPFLATYPFHDSLITLLASPSCF